MSLPAAATRRRAPSIVAASSDAAADTRGAAPAVIGADGKEATAAVLLRHGAFLQSIIDFVLVAFAIFIAVKAINRLRRQPAPADVAPAPPEDIVLLTEIRDALRAR